MIPTPAQQDLERFQRDVRAFGDPERYWRLNQREAVWKGLQYSSRPSFWNPEVPLQERAPCVNSSVAETAIGRLTDMVFGNARFPQLAPTESDYGIALTNEERKALAAIAQKIVKAAKLRLGMRAFTKQGLGVGSACYVASLRKGKLAGELLSAKFCTPTLDDCGEVLSLEVSYLTEQAGKPVRYRRVLDTVSDTTFHEMDARAVERGDPWVADPSRTVVHGFGFCPVYWHRNAPEVGDPDPVDGTCLFEGLEDEIEALDLAMSQRHRNGRYNGEPQIVRTGIDAEPTRPMGEQGREVDPAKADRGGRWVNAIWGFFGGGRAATKKAAGKIWDLPPGSDAKLLESTGAGATILAADIDGIRRVIYEARGIVIASPEQISANASAALMGELYAPMVGVADNLREEYGDALVSIVNLYLRILSLPQVQAAGVFVAGLALVLPLLTRLWVQTTDGPRWAGAPLEPTWGEYFEPTWTDVTQAVTAAQTGNGGKPVLTHLQSVQLVGRVAHHDDARETLAQIQAEEGMQQTAQGALLDRLGGAPTPRPMGTGEAPTLSYGAPDGGP